MSHFDSILLDPNVIPVPNPAGDNGSSVLRVAGLSIFAACFWVCVRFYTRTRLVFVLGWEDLMVVISLVSGRLSIGIAAVSNVDRLQPDSGDYYLCRCYQAHVILRFLETQES